MKLNRILAVGACAAFALTGITQSALAADKEHAEKKEKP